jgi:hypothetical protein
MAGSNCCRGFGAFDSVLPRQAFENQTGRQKEQIRLLDVSLTPYSFNHTVGAHWTFHDRSRAIHQRVEEHHGHYNDNDPNANGRVNFRQECKLRHEIKADCKDGHAQHELEDV